MDKQCCSCKVLKPATLEYFYPDKRKKTGLIGRCKPCWAAYISEWAKNNNDKMRAYDRQGYQRHREAILQRKAAWRAANLEKTLQSSRASRAANRHKRYGLTREEYEVFLQTREQGCAICGYMPGEKEMDLHIDHDHDTGKVRGWLCSACNTGIGLFRENPAQLRRAIEYLSGA